MSDTRQQVNYEDIIVGEDFNSRKSFREFVLKAFNGSGGLKPEAELKKALDDNGMKMLIALRELAGSIDAHGLLQPIVVRDGGPTKPDNKKKYFLIAGERRYRAIGLLRAGNPSKFRQVEVKFKKCSVDEAFICNIVENCQRENLAPMEMALNCQQLLAKGLSQGQIATQIKKSEPFVSQHLALLKAAPEVQAAVLKGDLTATHVREMTTLPATKQAEVLKSVEEKKAKGQKVSVADVKSETDKHKKALGIKREKERKPKAGEPEYDAEKVKAAKEIIGDRDINTRPKLAMLEQYGILSQRLGNPNISEATATVTKAKITVIEYYLGLRDSL